jgi:hypothetical protein
MTPSRLPTVRHLRIDLRRGTGQRNSCARWVSRRSASQKVHMSWTRRRFLNQGDLHLQAATFPSRPAEPLGRFPPAGISKSRRVDSRQPPPHPGALFAGASSKVQTGGMEGVVKLCLLGVHALKVASDSWGSVSEEIVAPCPVASISCRPQCRSMRVGWRSCSVMQQQQCSIPALPAAASDSRGHHYACTEDSSMMSTVFLRSRPRKVLGGHSCLLERRHAACPKRFGACLLTL